MPTQPSNLAIRALLAAALAALGLLALSGEAQASTYTVHECMASAPNVPDVAVDGGAPGYTETNGCPSYLQVGSTGAVPNGGNKQYRFSAPAGTQMNDVGMDFHLSATGGGNQDYLFIRRVGGSPVSTISTGGASTAGHYNTSINGGPVDQVGIGMVCANGNGCDKYSGAFSRLSKLNFAMQDTVAPGTPQTSGSTLSGWVNGTKGYDFSVSDTGAGVSYSGTYVNGTGVDLDLYCSADYDSAGGVTSLKPCPGSGSASTSFDVAAAPFVEGVNNVQVCVWEFGSGAQYGCKLDSVNVDTIAPTAPTGIAVGDGEDWKRDNSFDLSWTNPPQGGGGVQAAPIVGAEVRITSPSGAITTSYYGGSGKNSINGLSVPAKGDYTVQVYLRDAAGNETPANVSSAVHLRFDDTVPVGQKPDKANGWLSRQDLANGYPQGWEPVNGNFVPPSGIAGYRVVVNTNSDTDPCSGATDQRACGGPVTEAGASNITRTLHAADVSEGANYVHVVPVSGSGMRATDVKHTPLKVDLTDPVAVLRGDGNSEWINHDANLDAVGIDALSGMSNTAEFPDDAPPATFITVDGQQASATGATVSQAIGGEGAHQVQFWARDLAGNTGQPQSATVRIDKSAPSVAFTNDQDPDDPDKLVAPASDALSGVIGGRISFREVDGNEWKALDTVLQGGDLVARADSGELKPGTTYEFRAIAVDKAGNSAGSTRKQNGDLMRVTGPFRTLTGVVDLKVNGKSKARIAYKKKATVTGSLLTEVGQRPVRGALVTIEQTYAEGTKTRTSSEDVKTDGQGRFATKLAKGPSRAIVARYRGDRIYLGTSSAAAKLAIRSKISLKTPKRVDSDKGIVFKGKVKAKGAKLGKRKGKRVEVQVRVGKKWKAVARSFRANKKGKFKLAYKFTANYTQPVTFQFRAAVLRERGFPYLPSKSRKRSVTVTP